MGQYCKIWSWNATKLDFTPARTSHLCSLSLMFVCLFSSLMVLLQAGWKAWGDFEEVGTRNMYDQGHIAVTCCADSADVSICISAPTAIGNIGTAILNTYILLGQYFDKYRYKPISSLHQGQALVRLERAQLSRLRASSPAQHITNHSGTSTGTANLSKKFPSQFVLALSSIYIKQ